MLKHRVTKDSNSLLETFDKNMAFFKTHMNPVYEAVNNLEMKVGRLEIQEDGELNYLEHDLSLYRGAAYKYAEDESNKFLEQFSVGAPISTVAPPNSNMYSGERFYFQHINNTCNTLINEYPRKSNQFTLDKHLPLCVIFGIGLGIHIQNLLDNKDIHHIVVVENNLEKFKASCYVTPWYEIIPKFKILEGKTFNFIISSKKTNHEIFVLVWNQLVTLAPKFPLTSLFYNHRRDRDYKKVIDYIHKEFHTFLTSWGNYDDEINQLNHGLHNLQYRTPFLPQRNEHLFDDETLETPIIIVAGGPSVDERIEWIKEVKDDVFIVSAGSSLKTLKHYGIKPDLHFELESDYNTVTMFDFIGANFIKDIPVIAPIQISPLALNYFDNKRLFFKDSSAQIDLFNKDRTHPIIPHATPTCSNTALATMLYYGFKNIFLVGLDLSYKDIKKTHAEGSIYFDENAPEVVKHAVLLKEVDGKIKAKNMFGEDVFTDAIYYSVYKRVENCLREYSERKIYNISLGLNIEGSENINDKHLFINKIPKNNTENKIIKTLFNDDSNIISKKDIEKDLESLYFYIYEISKSISKIIDKMDNSIDSFDKAASIITYISEEQWKRGNYLYYFLRGTIWHYLYICYAHIYSLEDKIEIKNSIITWKKEFKDFLNKMQIHCKKITTRKLNLNDPWLYKSIYESVSEKKEETNNKNI